MIWPRSTEEFSLFTPCEQFILVCSIVAYYRAGKLHHANNLTIAVCLLWMTGLAMIEPDIVEQAWSHTTTQ